MRMTQEQVDAYRARIRATTPEQWPTVIASPAPPPKAKLANLSQSTISAQAMPSAMAPAPKRSKYGNRKVRDAEGHVHDSTKEFRHWQELQLRERAGEIRKLRRQVPFAICINGILVCQYLADAVYEEGAATVVEDCKSDATRKLPVFALKRKLMLAVHGIDIRIV